MAKFFGKYRGTVANNIDPLQQARLQVTAPAVLGDGNLSWAMPSVPYAGSQVGFFVLPPVGANIWVEFEGGNPDYPIWSGCFWGVGEVPVVPAIAETKVLKTESTTITLNDLPGAGGMTIEVNPPAVAVPLKVEFDSAGIKITCNPAVIEMKITGIEIQIPPAAVKLTPVGINLETPPAKVSLSQAAVEVANAAASVKLTPISVNINNGALEVI
jgi:Type VI secretion system/phage-baseplate injector OB domain